MPTLLNLGLSRRAVLQLGAAGAAVLLVPGPIRRRAGAQVASPHFLVVFEADGGWDPTQVFDAHDPNDATDGIDVDNPGQPASVITTLGGLTYVSNPVTRPAIDTFFTNWASRTAVVNGVNTRSTSHDQSRQLVLTGYLDPTKADFAVMSAHHNGAELPLPHLLVSGASFAGPYAGLSGRLGGAMFEAVEYDSVGDGQRAFSGLGEAYIQQALEFERLADANAPSGLVTGRLAEFYDGNVRGDTLAQLATSVNVGSNDPVQLATTLGQAFRNGLTTSVTVERFGGFDTHGDNTGQNGSFQNVFTFLDGFLTALAAEAGAGGTGNLLDQTTIVVCSEFGRTPRLNADLGKDHHPWNSYLLVGKRVRGGMTVGRTDGNQEGVKVNFSTGQPDDTGSTIDVVNVVAGIMTLVGANASEYMPGVPPFTAFIGA
jgi:uncharacterized protein (DUF1501 family)